MSIKNNIHPTAIVDESAKIADGVTIGPYAFIGPNVTIGENCEIKHHASIVANTSLGKNNRVYQYASVGEMSQDFSDDGKDTWLQIGDNNVFREFVTINRGTAKDQRTTKIGNHNYFMAYVHVAHDCEIRNHCLLANNASLAGHVVVHDHAIIGALCGIHQFCHIGSYTFIARAAQVPNSVPPYLLVTGPGVEVHGLNIVGLKRQGFSVNAVQGLRRAFKIIYRDGLRLEEALEELKKLTEETPETQLLIDFIEKDAIRNIVR